MGELLQHDFSSFFNAIGKSGRVLLAFSRFYMPFHNCDSRYLFDNFDVFGGISIGVYYLDEDAESSKTALSSERLKDVILSQIDDKIVIDETICDLLNDAEEYYRFEKHIDSLPYSIDDLFSITALRSFDFRIMHCSLLQLMRLPYNTQLLSWFSIFEQIMEIEDDLFSLEEDHTRRTFNIWNLAGALEQAAGIDCVHRHYQALCADLFSDENCKEDCDLRSLRVVFNEYRSIVPSPDISGVIKLFESS